MIDIHSHILPGMDDGSSSLEESLAMAGESARQGVRLLAATPHFYATQENPASFLRRCFLLAGMGARILSSIW